MNAFAGLLRGLPMSVLTMNGLSISVSKLIAVSIPMACRGLRCGSTVRFPSRNDSGNVYRTRVGRMDVWRPSVWTRRVVGVAESWIG